MTEMRRRLVLSVLVLAGSNGRGAAKRARDPRRLPTAAYDAAARIAGSDAVRSDHPRRRGGGGGGGSAVSDRAGAEGDDDDDGIVGGGVVGVGVGVGRAPRPARRWTEGDGPIDLFPVIASIQGRGRRRMDQQQGGGDDDGNDYDNDDDEAVANRLCSEYLVSFLEGTTDAKDTCEGIMNAFYGADCATTLSESGKYDGEDEDDYFGEFYEHMCCSSLQSHLSQYCEENKLITNMHLLLVCSVLLLCECAKSVVKKNGINFLPEAAVCILVGSLCGFAAHILPGSGIDEMSFDDEIFMSVLLPPIIFEAAISVSKPQFRRRRGAIFMLAVVGTVLSSFMTGLMVHFASRASNAMTIPMLDSLIFGALISSIDPVAILSVLSSLNLNQTDMIFILVFGESLLNDGVAITLFQSLVERGAWGPNGGITLTTDEVFGAVADFFIVAFGSIGVGLACGLLALIYFWMFQNILHPVMEVGSFFLWALVPYYISDGVDWSGIVAIVVMGFFMDLYIASPHGVNLSAPAASNRPGPGGGGHGVGHGGGGGHGGDGAASLAGSHAGDFYLNFEEHATPSADLCEEPCGRGRSLLSINLPQLLSGTERVRLSSEADKHVRFVAHLLSALSENAIFAYLGLFLLSNNYTWDLTLCAIAIVACVLSRALMVVIVCYFFYQVHRLRVGFVRRDARKRALAYGREMPPIRMSRTAEKLQDKRMQFVLVLAGLRGAVSLALMEDVPIYNSVTKEGCEFKPLLKAMTSSSIIFTTFVFGGGAYYILPHLGIRPHKEAGRHGHLGSGSDLSSTNGGRHDNSRNEGAAARAGGEGRSAAAPGPDRKVTVEMATWRWSLCHYDQDDLDSQVDDDEDEMREGITRTNSQLHRLHGNGGHGAGGDRGAHWTHDSARMASPPRESAREMPSIITQDM